MRIAVPTCGGNCLAGVRRVQAVAIQDEVHRLPRLMQRIVNRSSHAQVRAMNFDVSQNKLVVSVLDKHIQRVCSSVVRS